MRDRSAEFSEYFRINGIFIECTRVSFGKRFEELEAQGKKLLPFIKSCVFSIWTTIFDKNVSN